MGYVGIELTEVLVGELLVFQFNDDTTMKDAIVEHKVGIVVFIIDDDTLLTWLKTESLAKFEYEILHVVDQGIFQVVLIDYLLCLQPEKFERERIAYLQFVAVVTLNGRQR